MNQRSRYRSLVRLGLIAVLAGVSAHRIQREEPDDLHLLARETSLSQHLPGPLSFLRDWSQLQGGQPRPVSAAAVSAYSRLTGELRDERSGVRLHRAAGAELLFGRLSQAITLMTEAAALLPQSAEIQNDLAVAHLALAESADAPHDSRARALDAAGRSVRLAPESAISWYNHGLAALGTGLSSVAQTSWARAASRTRHVAARKALERRIEETADDEGRDSERLRREIGRALVQTDEGWMASAYRHPQEFREALSETLFVAWSDAVLLADFATANVLRARLKGAASWQQQFDGDRLLVACAEALPVVRGPDPRARSLARGHRLYASGIAARRVSGHEEALVSFKQAARLLEGAASACAAEARTLEGLATLQVQGAQRAWPIVAAVRSATVGRDYFSLKARAEWAAALAHVEFAQSEAALAAYDEALEGYARTREEPNRCAILRASTDLLRSVGEYGHAWRRLREAMVCLARDRDPLRRYLVLFEASLLASDEGLAEAAIVFQNEAVAAAAERGVARTATEALLWRARLHARLRNEQEAKADLIAARKAVAGVAADAVHFRRYVESWAARIEGELSAATDPARSIAAIDAAREFFERHDPDEVPFLHMTRGRALAASGDSAAAEGAWREGLSLADSRYRGLSAHPRRAAYTKVVSELVHALALARFSRGDINGSLEISEWGRPGALGAGAHITTRDRLPEDTLLIRYAVLSDRLLIWSLSRSATVAWSVPLPESQLGALVRAFVRSLRDATTGIANSAEGAMLASLLLGRLDLTPYREIVIVPDGPLSGLPFAALRRDGGGYLIETHRLSFSPSVSAAGRGDPPSALLAAILIEGPARPAEGLLPLPAVKRELAAIRRLYRKTRVIAALHATPEVFLNAAQGTDVLHFAGHARGNPVFPWQSHLVLSEDAAHPTGRLTAEEIAKTSAFNLSLVVLAACSTAGDSHYRGGGQVGLADTFLIAGAREVVGSLWEVDDRAAALLLTRFHEEYRRSRDAVASLRAAQLALLRGADPTGRLPVNWAVFTVTAAAPYRSRS